VHPRGGGGAGGGEGRRREEEEQGEEKEGGGGVRENGSAPILSKCISLFIFYEFL